MALDFGKLNFSTSFNPTSGFPIDARTYFESFEAAQAAAATAEEAGSSNTVYYYGQILTVYEDGAVSAYQISGDKSLVKLAETTASGDLEADVIALQGQVTALQTAVNTTIPATYATIETVSGIDTRVTAAEGEIDTLQTDVDAVEATVTEHTSDITSLESNVSALQTNVSDIDTRLNTAETKLATIEEGAEVNILEGVSVQTTAGGGYAPVAINEKIAQLDLSSFALKSDISSVFNFRGTVATYGNLPTEGQVTGDVWIVSNGEGAEDNQEYVWTGSAWEALGVTVDLSGYATTANVTSAIEAATNDMATQTWVTGTALTPYATTANIESAITTATNDMATQTWVNSTLTTEFSDYVTINDFTSNIATKADVSTVTALQNDVTTAEENIATLQSNIIALEGEIDTIQEADYQTASDVTSAIATATIEATQINGAVANAGHATLADALVNSITVNVNGNSQSFNGGSGNVTIDITAASLGALTEIPVASADTLGGIKVGHVDSGSGTEHAVQLDNNNAAYVTVPTYTGTGAVNINDYVVSIVTSGITNEMLAGGITSDKIESVSTDALIQGNEELILNGGSSSENA